MNKRIISVFLSVFMVAALACMPAGAVLYEADMMQVEETAEGYLRTQMNRVYFWDEPNAAPDTILNVTSSSGRQLDEDSAKYIEENSKDVLVALGRNTVTRENMAEDLRTMEAYVLYRAYLFEDMNIGFADFSVDYYFDEVSISGNNAVVTVYEALDYQYDDCDEPSSELNYYYLVLQKHNGKWYVADIVSDDWSYLSFLDAGESAEEAIAGYKSAVLTTEENISSLVEKNSASDNSRSVGDIAYNVSNAKNYALMYTTTANNPVNDGGAGTEGPDFKNPRFKWWDADCMNFASQCVWAGFGGSNNWSHVNNGYGMDKVGASDAYKWWSSNSTSSPSWRSCSNFYTYVKNSANGTAKGLVCDYKETAYNSSTINWDYSYTDLIGAVMHVRGKNSSGNWVAAAHAVFVNNATSKNRSDIYVCCYNSCKKNVKLGTYWAAGNDSTHKVVTIAPRTFVQGEDGARVWGDWVTNVTTTNVSRTLRGYGNQIFSTLTMKLMNPAGGVVQTWTATNASTVSGTYANWNSTGDQEWIIEVSGTTSGGQTVTWNGAVRVAK